MIMKHIGIFEYAEDIENALNQRKLENPYVALVTDGNWVDINGLRPVMGKWDYVGEDSSYWFNINEKDPSYWRDPVQIATFPSILNGNEVVARVGLYSDGDNWIVGIDAEGESDYDVFSVGTDEVETFETSNFALGTSEPSDTVPIQVEIEGGNYIMFQSTDNESAPLYMDTINPEYPE